MMLAVPLAEDQKALSQASFAYQKLRESIIYGENAPNARLKIADLAKHYGVSPGAIREALSRLVSEQLVVSKDQHGYRAAPISLSDLIELTDLRCEIENLAIRRSLANATVDWEAELVASSHRLSRSQRISPEDPTRLTMDWVRNHARFHAALVAACDNKRILELHQQLYEQSERYRSVSVRHENASRDVGNEHEDLLNAALAHDVDKLVELSVNHLRRTTDLLLAQPDVHHQDPARDG